MKKVAMLGVVGVVMLAGAFVRGQEKVDVQITSPAALTLPDGSETTLLKAGGSFSGTHQTQPSNSIVKAKMVGRGKGTVSVTDNGTFSGSVGNNPSKSVNDTKVIVKYLSNKTEKMLASGSDKLTVVGVTIKLLKAIQFRLRLAVGIRGKALPEIKGGRVFIRVEPVSKYHNFQPGVRVLIREPGAFVVRMNQAMFNAGDSVELEDSVEASAIYFIAHDVKNTPIVQKPR